MKGHSDIIFARRLREFRRQARVTQKELASQMTAAGHKILPSAICNIETGRRLVSIGEAVQFAAALGIPLLALLTDGPRIISSRPRRQRGRCRRRAPPGVSPGQR